MNITRTRALMLAAMAGMATGRAQAAPDTWLGATDGNWDTPTNWSLGNEPTAADDAIFPTPVPATGAAIVLTPGELANSLTFNATAYTLNGGTLTLSSGVDANSGRITVGSGFTASINSQLLLNPVIKDGAGTVNVGGNVLGNTNNGLTISAGTYSISALNQRGVGAVTVNNTGALRFAPPAPTVQPAATIPVTFGATFNPGSFFHAGPDLTVAFNSNADLGTQNYRLDPGTASNPATLSLLDQPGAATVVVSNVIDSTGGGGGGTSANTPTINVAGADDVLRTTAFLENAETGRHAFRKTGPGTWSSEPPTVNTGTNTWGLRIEQGTVRVNQLPYASSVSGGVTGVLEFAGNNTVLEVLAAPSALPTTNFNTSYGWQQFQVQAGFTGTVKIAAGAIFKNNGRSNNPWTIVQPGATLNLEGADDTARIQFGWAGSGSGNSAVGSQGTINLRGGTLSVFAGNTDRSYPTQTDFTQHLNGGIVDGSNMPTLNGNLVINNEVDGTGGDLFGTPRITAWAVASTGNTSWRGTLEKIAVSPTVAGTLTLNRTGGTVTVAPGSTLAITTGTVSAGGTADPFTDNSGGATNGNRVAINNNATFNVTAGTKGVASVTGTGTTTVAAGATLGANFIRQGTVTVNGQVAIRPRAAGGDTSSAANLVIAGVTGAWTGRLDLADTAMVIDYDPAGPSKLGTVADQVRTGYAGGAWTGNGITSTLAGGSLSVGYAEASRALGVDGGTFQGVMADGSAILLRLTRFGDANVDGTVNGSDLSLLLNNFGATSGRTWQDGDFNHDEAVNGSDLSLLLNNFGGSAALAGLSAEEAERLAAITGASVPEPAAPGVVGLLLAWVGTRRRRRVGGRG